MQAEKSAFFIYQTSVMPLLGGKGTGLPRIRVKAALRAGRLKENHPRCAPVFSAKTLHRRNTDLLKPVEVNPADSSSIIIKNKNHESE